MPKKLAWPALLIMLACALLLGFSTATAVTYYKTYPVARIVLNGNEVATPDVPAFIIDGRVVVPLRVVAEAMQAEVEWSEGTRTVTITRPDLVPPPAKDKISFSPIQLRGYNPNSTEVSGRVTNNNSNSVHIRFTVNFIEARGPLGHVHVELKSASPGEATEFYALIKENVQAYERIEITIDELEWT
ncbi:MAG: copper amine oxidase N-terminal domain-containing protein [Peptococcaceae bacterium]|jgi:hypothetical protein|nr:copper amine oxidase N-terminal domain-containing protein [Peptococcaceae bacterium]MDH7524824.1 copper amine oxidase N-terminal domain-containing protein [Peptococcaceae bacterium]